MGTGFGFLVGTIVESEAQKDKVEKELNNRAATVFLDETRSSAPNFNAREQAVSINNTLQDLSKKTDKHEIQSTRELLAETFSSMTRKEYSSVLDEMDKLLPESKAKFPHLMHVEKDGKLSFKMGPDGTYFAGTNWLEFPVKNWNSQAEAQKVVKEVCSDSLRERIAGQKKLDDLNPRQLSVITRNGDLNCKK